MKNLENCQKLEFIWKPKAYSVQNFLIHHNSFLQSRDMSTFLQVGEIRIVPLFVFMAENATKSASYGNSVARSFLSLVRLYVS